MKSKSVFLKKIASFILSLSIIAGTLACLSASTLSAVTETLVDELKPGVLSRVVYDFEDEMDGITFLKEKSSTADPAVVDITGKDNITTNALKIQTYNWNWTKVIFPFELEAGSTYKISYDYKCHRTPVSLTNNSAILAANSEGKTVSTNRFGFFIQESGNFDWNLNKINDTTWHSRKFSFTPSDTQVDADYKYLAIMLADTTGTEGYIYLDNIVIEKVNPNITAYDFDTEVPTYRVKKPWNMGDSAVSVATDPDQNSNNKLLELKMIKGTKSLGVDFKYVLESNTSYKISYRYKGDGNFNMPGEADTSQQSGFFPDTFENREGAFDWDANVFYPITEKLAKFRESTGGVTVSTAWTEVTRTFTTGTVDESKKYLSLVIHSAISAADYASLYIDDIVIEKVDIGDVKQDGKVDNDDFVMLRKILLGIDVGEYIPAVANCHYDGQEIILDIRDLVTLKKLISDSAAT